MLRIGARPSRLAQAQAEEIAAAIARVHPGAAARIVPIASTGDKDRSAPIHALGGKGVFLKELEEALLDGRIDLAVHSMKDVPSELPAGLVLGPVPARVSRWDVLVLRPGLDAASGPLVVGTGSPRRAAELLRLRPHWRIVGVRGNVQTRVKRLEDGEFDALVLAEAGLARLRLRPRQVMALGPDEMLPAAGQGALALEHRAGDDRVAALLAGLGDAAAEAEVAAERALVRLLEVDCGGALGVAARADGEALHLRARALSPEGRGFAEAWAAGPVGEPEELAEAVAASIRAQGGARLLVAAPRPVALSTRDEAPGGPLALALEAEGFRAEAFPLVRHEFLPAGEWRGMLADEGPWDWLVLASARGVEALRAAFPDGPAGAGPLAVAAAGRSTAAAARDAGLRVEIESRDGGIEALARELAATLRPGARVLSVGAESPARELAELLPPGTEVRAAAAYRTRARPLAARDRTLLAGRPGAGIALCSPSAARALASAGPLPRGCRVAAIGPSTAAAAQAAGLRVDAVAATASFAALARALRESLETPEEPPATP